MVLESVKCLSAIALWTVFAADQTLTKSSFRAPL